MSPKKRKKIEEDPLSPTPEAEIWAAEEAAPAHGGFSIGRLFRWLGTGLRWLMVLVLALLCALVFFIAVIMGEAPELGHEDAVALEAPLPLPAPGQFASADLSTLAAYFPGPLATFPSGSGITLTQGSVRDETIEGISCRVVSLRYAFEGAALTLYSATPSGFLLQYDTQGVSLSANGVTMGNLPGIVFESGGTQYLAARKGELVYVLEAPTGIKGLIQLGAWVGIE